MQRGNNLAYRSKALKLFFEGNRHIGGFFILGGSDFSLLPLCCH